MQFKLVYGMLCMGVYTVAGPIAVPGEAPASNTAPIKAPSTPLDLKVDLGLVGKLLPFPLRKLVKPGEPLQLKVSVGPPGKGASQEENREPSREPSIDRDGGIEVEESTSYIPYNGNGTPEQGWPTPQQWISYGSMKNLNYDLIMKSCGNNGWGVPDNSPQETDEIFHSIERISRTVLLDKRFILAVLLQESKGCVRVPATRSHDGVRNPGLMQSHNGAAMCNSGTPGAPKYVLSPCPEEEILGMIYEGVVGASDGPDDVSLLKMITRSGMGTVADLYRAARMYNTGPWASMWNLEDVSSGTASYASDVANRMTGWVG